MNRKLRIAMISEHASPMAALGGVDSGGQNVYVGHLAQRLAALGYEVDVFTRRDSPDLDEVVEWQPGVRIVNVPAGPPVFVRKEALLPFMERFTAYMCRRWSSLGPYDLLHANFWMSGLVAAELKQRTGTPFVITFHALGRVRRLFQGDADEFPDVRDAIEERLVAEADRIIAECPQDRSDLINLYHADPGKMAIVPCGFDPDELAPVRKSAARRALGIRQDDRAILQLGRLVPRKGVDTAVEAVARLKAEHGVDAGLYIVGGESDEPDPDITPEIGRLQRLAQDLGVEDRVRFAGRRSRRELACYYSAADVFVTTPWYEPFGITPLEAMACGTPVVGASVGGIKYSVRDGETGFLVPPRDAAAVAERCARILNDAALAGEMSRRAIERANRFFTWGSVADSMAALYEDVLGSRSPEQLRPGVETIAQGFDDAARTLRRARDELSPLVCAAGEAIGDAFARGGKLLVCGNGGSAADAQHLVAELVGRYRQADRVALPALALTTDTSVITAWANDSGFDEVFARQVEALGRQGDVLLLISTSGQSANVVRAAEAARDRGLYCIALAGKGGGALLDLADLCLVVPSEDTQRIQETHTLLIHLICEVIEGAPAAPPARTANETTGVRRSRKLVHA